ncbi:CGNR zinc finger domain-containing protein [Sinomonas atrocyanea]|uniref:CGNR zinc finger domain-containing protein n=1 Tax=Sinomonas atrocyanea TaxID=37927 RepID=UPI002784AA4D|nr:CGNR zinc finger domain-containing protein [Sinomonas atrocyanea]MDQ0260692.1 putative RNA-binding Zn ribbon-like protein [Sinomonas atrocyanea]MDR6622325.1 putative RNA-binding Zn ribbon-like protein [Sinomonas atrocyanea]
MIFAHDTEVALRSVVNLVNTLDPLDAVTGEHLATGEDLDRFLVEEQFTGSRTHDAAELAGVRALRTRLRTLWDAAEDEAVDLVNALLREARALPQLVKHDHWDWHLHATTPQAPLADRMGTEAAMALVDVIRSKELDRLRVCAAEDCEAVLIDLTKNRSKRYCDTGNCANRSHVRAYRERKAAG